MGAMIRFFRTMLMMRGHWLAWQGLLMALNMLVPLFYIQTPEAIAVLAATMAAAMTMMAIFARLGFVRLMGLGHFYWLPLILWLWTRQGAAEPGSLFLYWMQAVMLGNALSLVIDAVDAVRYLRGEREPTLTLPGSA